MLDEEKYLDDRRVVEIHFAADPASGVAKAMRLAQDFLDSPYQAEPRL